MEEEVVDIESQEKISTRGWLTVVGSKGSVFLVQLFLSLVLVAFSITQIVLNATNEGAYWGLVGTILGFWLKKKMRFKFSSSS